VGSFPTNPNPRKRNVEKAQKLSPELWVAVEPLLADIDSLSQQIRTRRGARSMSSAALLDSYELRVFIRVGAVSR